MSMLPIINAQDVNPMEFKFNEFIRGIASAADGRCAVEIQKDVPGHTGRTHNRYTLIQGRQSITVDFRIFTVNELPKNFQNAAIRSPRNRAMIGTLKTLGMNDLIAAVLTWLNETINTTFAPGSHMYYALQTKVNNLHAFYYSEQGTERKVVVQLQL